MDPVRLAIIILLLRQRRRRRYLSCTKCNPPRLRNEENSSSNETSVTVNTCNCTSPSEDSSESGTENSGSELIDLFQDPKPDENKEIDTNHKQTAHINSTQIGDNSILPSNEVMPTTDTRNTNIVPTNNITIRSVEAINKQSTFVPPLKPTMSHIDDYGSMEAIEYWVRTHRPPCTFGLVSIIPPKVKGNEISARNPITSTVAKKERILPQPITEIISPIEAQKSTVNNKSISKRKLSFLDDDSLPDKTDSKVIFQKSLMSENSKLLSKNRSKGDLKSNKGISNKQINTAKSRNIVNELNKSTNSREDVGKSTSKLINKTADSPSAQEELNIFSNAINRSHNHSINSKITSDKKNKVIRSRKSFNDSPQIDKGQNQSSKTKQSKVILDVSSESSVLTAPYIRSTRNNTSKTNCRKLSQQRATRSKTKALNTSSSSKPTAADVDSTEEIFTFNKSAETNRRNGESKGAVSNSLPKNCIDSPVKSLRSQKTLVKAVSMQNFNKSTQNVVQLKRKSVPSESTRSPIKRNKKCEMNESKSPNTRNRSQLNKSRSRLSNVLSDSDDDLYVKKKKIFL